MEIGRMNGMNAAAGAVTSQPFDLPTRKTTPTESSAPVERSGGSDSISALDIAKLEKAMAETEQDGDGTTEEFLQQLIEKVNSRLDTGNRAFDYSRHQKTGQLVVKIIDRETKKVIREIPPEKTLDAVARMWDMMGIFVDNKT